MTGDSGRETRLTAVVQLTADWVVHEEVTLSDSECRDISKDLAEAIDVTWADDLVSMTMTQRMGPAPLDVHVLIEIGMGAAAGAAAIEFVKGAAGEAGKRFWTGAERVAARVLRRLWDRQPPGDLSHAAAFLVLNLEQATVVIKVGSVTGFPTGFADRAMAEILALEAGVRRPLEPDIEEGVRREIDQWRRRWPDVMRLVDTVVRQRRVGQRRIHARRPALYVWIPAKEAPPMIATLPARRPDRWPEEANRAEQGQASLSRRSTGGSIVLVDLHLSDAEFEHLRTSLKPVRWRAVRRYRRRISDPDS
jgi:hypothetical protein